MKKIITTGILATGLLLASNAVLATVINFDNTTSAITSFSGGGYVESGFTLTRIGDTELATLDAAFSPSNYPSQNNTDFAQFERQHFLLPALSLTAINPFSLQSFNAAHLGFRPADSLTLTGHVSGGGILSQIFTTQGNNQWSLFSLTGWNNLTSVDIVSQGAVASLDNITVNADASTVSEPSVLWLCISGFAGLSLFKKHKRV